MKKWLRWLPNAMTFSRWLAAPPILICDLTDHWWWAAGFLYWAVFSDMVDGILARKLGVAGSRFGITLDRYGDTLLVTLATAGLVLTHLEPFWIGLFAFGLAWVVILEMGKRYLPEKNLFRVLFTQALRLYYIAVISVLMILYYLVAGGPVWILIVLSVSIACIGLYVKRDRIKTF